MSCFSMNSQSGETFPEVESEEKNQQLEVGNLLLDKTNEEEKEEKRQLLTPVIEGRESVYSSTADSEQIVDVDSFTIEEQRRLLQKVFDQAKEIERLKTNITIYKINERMDIIGGPKTPTDNGNGDGNISEMSEQTRHEEKWTPTIEHQLSIWMKECAEASMLHGKSAKKFKKLDRLYWIPIVILPAVIIAITSIWGDECGSVAAHNARIALTLFILFNAIFGGFYKLENPAVKKEKHYQFEALYANLVDVIELESSRNKNFRRPADVVISEVRMEIKHLRLNAPPYSLSLCSCFYWE